MFFSLAQAIFSQSDMSLSRRFSIFTTRFEMLTFDYTSIRTKVLVFLINIFKFTACFIKCQSELDRRHQSFFIHHVPPARATDKKNSKIGNKELRNEIMQPESSMDRGHFNSEIH